MFTGLGGYFPPEQIRNFLYDAQLVDPETNIPLDPCGIYNAAVEFKIGETELENAMGWTPGTIFNWIQTEAANDFATCGHVLNRLEHGDYVPTTRTPLGNVRDELVQLQILDTSNRLYVNKAALFFQYLTTNNIKPNDIDLVLGWPVGSTARQTMPIAPAIVPPVTTPTTYNENPAVIPPTVIPVTTNPAPRTTPTPMPILIDHTGNPYNNPQTSNPVITVPAPIDQTTNTGIVPPAQSSSKLPIFLAIGAALLSLGS